MKYHKTIKNNPKEHTIQYVQCTRYDDYLNFQEVLLKSKNEAGEGMSKVIKRSKHTKTTQMYGQTAKSSADIDS